MELKDIQILGNDEAYFTSLKAAASRRTLLLSEDQMQKKNTGYAVDPRYDANHLDLVRSNLVYQGDVSYIDRDRELELALFIHLAQRTRDHQIFYYSAEQTGQEALRQLRG